MKRSYPVLKKPLKIELNKSGGGLTFASNFNGLR